MFTVFLLLVGFHFLCDYPLQGDFLSTGKGSFLLSHHGIPWYHCMTAHCAIHALAVGIITANPYLGLAEFVCHFVLDYLKCKRKINIDQDQAGHILCKVVWAAI